MTPDDIKALRRDLGCTARDLAAAIGVEQEDVLAWERGDLFPTKRLVDKMAAIAKIGPSAVPKRKRGAPKTPIQALATPDFWKLVRKLAVHDDLRTAAIKLADAYPDPADEA